MGDGILVIGSSKAGLRAARDLANVGIKVTLADSAPFMGGITGEGSKSFLQNTLLLELAKHPLVNLMANTRLNNLEESSNGYKAQLVREPRYVDLSKCTACGDCVEVCPVISPGTDHKAIHLSADLQPGCAVVDKSGKAPCAAACPGGINVQGYVALIAEGRFEEAAALIREAIPLPGICGRICVHPCELDCRRNEIDKPVSIRLLKRFTADFEHKNRKNKSPKFEMPPKGPDSRQVAIIGSGPAGITAAERLAKAGHEVTIFEKLPVIGGMIAVGIPAYRLPRDIIAQEYDLIKSLGVKIKLNTTIGPDGKYSIEDLFKKGFDAVLLTTGAHKSLSLGIKGEDLPGVIHGIELLKNISLEQQTGQKKYTGYLKKTLKKGEKTRAIVLGGGNTAMDVSRSLVRQGLKDVRILYRRTRDEMPALPEEIEDAEHEGVIIEFLTAPVKARGSIKTGVTGLECIRMELGDPDESGRRRPVPIDNSEFTVDTDIIVLAIGQTLERNFINPKDKIKISKNDRIEIRENSFQTGRSGVFAAGDAVTRSSMSAIEAIGMGKKAAAEICAFLAGEKPQVTTGVTTGAATGEEYTPDVKIARRELTPEEKVPITPVQIRHIGLKKRCNTYDEVEKVFSRENAMEEAARCLVCGPCSECLACEKVCKPKAIVHDDREKSINLDIPSVIYADDPAHINFAGMSGKCIYVVPPDNSLEGSAAAARSMAAFRFENLTNKTGKMSIGSKNIETDTHRTGVFVCKCGGFIDQNIDTESISNIMMDIESVSHSETLDFTCSTEAAVTISGAVKNNRLDSVVIAGCSCCSLDQVCYSCTFQRVRLKENLGLFGHSMSTGQCEDTADYAGLIENIDLESCAMEFVNIREQCAWVHMESRNAATKKATAMISAAVTKVGTPKTVQTPADPSPDKSILIFGTGASGRVCGELLQNQGLNINIFQDMPTGINRINGSYNVIINDASYKGAAIVLAPLNRKLNKKTQNIINSHAVNPADDTIKNGQGVFFCDPALDENTAGPATAIRIRSWIESAKNKPDVTTAVVDSRKCRACYTCVDICEFGAPVVAGQGAFRHATIDPMVCGGCGTCMAHCPTGAITAGYSTDKQLNAMVETLLSGN